MVGKKIDNDDDIYDLNGFQIRSFAKQLMKGLISEARFDSLDIREMYEYKNI